MNEHKDIAYLQMAYGLAEKAIGWASPNPYVGAVILNRGIIVGYGYHKKPGEQHAEIIALERAGSRAKNGTAYITLEPCTHWGRTPPCVDKVLQAKLRRVVVSAYDPNPLVYKQGVMKMRQAGIEVSVGLLQAKNQQLNETYIKYITNKIPFVTLKTAVSLDGKTATKAYDSQWISSAMTRDYAHLLRGEYDAIMVGINTLLRDDPKLTIRHSNWKGKHLARVILDSQLRFPLTAQIIATLSQGKILVFTHKQASPQKAEALRKKGIEVIPISQSSGKIHLPEVLSWLGKHEISSVLVEGGGQVHTSLLEEKLVDKIILALSPKMIGGKQAPTFFQGNGVDFIKEAFPLKKIRSFRIDDDIIVEGYF
jgi:diaminohydroxyphosphoribosylaminopyrimidine deaminase/5-amino-6-(5-phosphoribosylamino)uracil reductase